ncbi:MAG: SRPBCC domain-containing protein [Gammaproteobacteria bacterium]|nr:SRPBCC domain-containing protein [Gammaproteobacteria bacterium]
MNVEKLSARAGIRIRKTPSEVFAVFADASAMSKFWFTRRDGGLKQGESISWFVGSGEDAVSFDVRVKELSYPNRIVIEWGHDDGQHTQVTWSLEETEHGDTILAIEESGFTGSSDAMLERALDSTGGFNQVIIAAKALVEHGVELNVVADHA